MKAKYFVLLSILLCNSIFAQEEVKLKDGRTLIIEPNGTWKYKNEITVADKYLIRPGVGIGKILIGSNRKEVLSILGKPQYDSYTWTQRDSWESGLTVYYRDEEVYQINVITTDYHTSSGLSVSTDDKEFLQAYPKCKKLCCEFYGASGGEEWISWDAITEGIALQKVSSITGSGGFNDAIIVHKADEPIKQFEMDDEKCKTCP